MTTKSNSSIQTKTFSKGSLIIKEGQESKETFLIKKGYVTIYKVTNNQKLIIEQLGPGEIFGEMGVLAGSKRSANAVALEESTEVIVLQKQVLSDALKKSPPLISTITNLLIKRLNKTGKILYEGSEHSLSTDTDISYAYPKICSLLEIICMTYPENSAPLKMPLFVLSSKIQKIVVISKIEIDHIFKKLKELNMIEIIKENEEQFVIINDPSKFLKNF